ncbi:MAG TPA: diguanylate cyclase [Steroidobacteraceae bacterium]|jgi:diguanylate cyclase (GGDEF)-like protein|nr:diguanylate cyclase [Steroidobacteraceae bacterium]
MTQRAKPAVRRWNAIVRISAALVLLAWLPLLPARAQDPGAGTAATATTPNPVEALIERGTMAMWTDPDASKREADEALELLKKNPDPDREIRARLLICDYQSERDTAAAQREIAAATALLSQATRQGLRAGILDCEGESLENSGDNTKAMAQYTEAASVATSEHDDEMLALSLYSRGYLLGVMGDYATGLIELRRADALFEKLKKPLHELVTLNSIATIYNRMGDYVQARHIYTRALAAQRQAGLQREQVVTLYNLGRANENLHDWDASRTAFAETLEISRKINYLRGEAYGMRGLAAVANALGDPEGALDTLKSAEVIQKQVPDSRLRAQIQLARGIALHKLQRLPESTQALESALVDFRQADALYELNQVYSELAAVYAETGNWRDAYARQVDAKTTSDKLLKNQLDQGFATLKVEFDTATQDKENAALKKQNEANQRALAQARSVRRLQATVIILTISLVLLLTLLAVFQHRSTLRMHLLAMTDELTGVPNRRAVLGRLDPLLRRDDPAACSILIVDIDYFKAINDQLGHSTGDEVLKVVAATVRAAVSEPAFFGRLGGEEFLIVLPATGLSQARATAQSFCEKIEAIDTSRWFGERRHITCSIGVSTSVPGRDTPSTMLQRADAALYAAKRGGRNCVRTEPAPEPDVGAAAVVDA